MRALLREEEAPGRVLYNLPFCAEARKKPAESHCARDMKPKYRQPRDNLSLAATLFFSGSRHAKQRYFHVRITHVLALLVFICVCVPFLSRSIKISRYLQPLHPSHAPFPTGLGSAIARSFCEDPNFQIVFREEFDEPTLNASRWTVRNASTPNDSSCRDARCMASNVELSGGMLRLTAREEASAWAKYTTGAIESRDKAFWQATGGSAWRMCVFGSLPGGRGTGAGYWPAFWMMPNDPSCWPDHGELDIMEQINGEQRVYATYHTSPAAGGTCKGVDKSEGGSLELATADFNEYAVEVNGDGSFVFVYNGDLVHAYNSTAGLPLHVNPWYLILNFAIGGPWPQPPNASTVFPAVVSVDYVRVAVGKV